MTVMEVVGAALPQPDAHLHIVSFRVYVLRY